MDVAKHVAETIVGDLVKTDMSTLYAIVQKAAAQLPDSSGLRIAVSSDDYSSFKRLLEDEDSMIVLSQDNTIESGTCRIISSQQDILIDPVAAVDNYLSTLRTELLSPPSPHTDAPHA